MQLNNPNIRQQINEFTEPIIKECVEINTKEFNPQKGKTMIIIGTILFPETAANEVAKCYQNLPPMPDFITIDNTYVYNKSGEDCRAFAIFNFEEAHLEEAKIYFKARYEAFGSVKDLTSKYEEWLNVQDALTLADEGAYDLDFKTF